MKKILSLLLAMLMLVGCTSVALAEEKVETLGVYDTTTKTFTVNNDVKTIKQYAFKERNDIVEVVIPESVETIEKDAFLWCESLAKVTLSQGLKKIGENAFGGCFALKEIYVPSSVETIGNLALGFIDKSTDSFSATNAEVNKGFTIIAEYGSAGQQYAYKNGIKYQDLNGCKKHTYGKQKVAVKKICGKQKGVYYKQCENCKSRTFTFTNKNHNFDKNSKKVVKKATFFKNGTTTKYCKDCKKTIKIKTYKSIDMPYVERKVYKNKVVFSLEKAQKGVTHYQIKLSLPDGKTKTITAKINQKIIFKGLKTKTNYDYTRRYVIKEGKKTVKGDWYVSSFKTK